MYGEASRLGLIRSYPPDIFICQCSINDGAGSSATHAATLAYMQAVRAILPSIPLIFVGPQAAKTGPSANVTSLETYGKAAFDQFADANSYWIANSNAVPGAWINGTGYVGGETSTGNADLCIAEDGHPSPYGSFYYARRLADAIGNIINGL